MKPLWANSARTTASTLTGCLLSVACCLLLAGCRNSGRQMQADLYQRELRLQEDEIYRLEDYIEEYQGIISGYRCKIADLQRELAAGKETTEPTRATLPSPSPTVGDEIDMGPTLIETPEPAELKPPAADSLPVSEDIAPPFNPSAVGNDADLLDAAPPFKSGANAAAPATLRLAAEPRELAPLQQASAIADAEPGRINLPPNPYPTASSRAANPRELRNAEPAPEIVGDPSIQLNTERGDSTSSLVAIVGEAQLGALNDFKGEASVMLTDPTADGRQRRIARWDFSPAEVYEALDSNEGSLALTIALPESTPTNQPLRLWVRLIDHDGARRLQASQVFFTGTPPELADTDSRTAQSDVRRLPPTEAFSAEPAMVAESNDSGWRAASSSTTDRKYDAAVAPASYEQAW